MDDGRSDAATIAEPVRVACRKYYLLRDNDDRGYAINIVLKRRSSAKKTAAQREADAKAAVTPWVDCVLGGAYKLDDGTSDPSAIADRIRPVCASLYKGSASEEQGLVILAVRKVREHNAQTGQGRVVSPPQKMPPGELRF